MSTLNPWYGISIGTARTEDNLSFSWENVAATLPRCSFPFYLHKNEIRILKDTISIENRDISIRKKRRKLAQTKNKLNTSEVKTLPLSNQTCQTLGNHRGLLSPSDLISLSPRAPNNSVPLLVAISIHLTSVSSFSPFS